MLKPKETFKVTPWIVEGEVNYEILVEKFGLRKIDREILNLFISAIKEIPPLIRRGIFFSHRDLDKVLREFLQGKKFYLYTGRGPSGPMHIGHIVPFLFTKYLQEKFKADLYIQITSDEKYMYHKEYKPEELERRTIDNILDILALGFDEKRTYVIDDLVDIKYIYPISISIARKVNFSVVRAVFGFNESTNIGMIFFPAIQAAPCFIGYFVSKENKNCLIPAAVDQDPYWRITRDIAFKLGFPKPAQIHGKFLPSLKGLGKMSSSIPESSIYLSDDEVDVRRKIWNAFTGGQPSIREQRIKGGNPDICRVYSYMYFLFEPDDKRLKEIYEECRGGRRICGDCKEELINKINYFLKKHKQKRESIKEKVKNYMLSEKVSLEDLERNVYRLLR